MWLVKLPLVGLAAKNRHHMILQRLFGRQQTAAMIWAGNTTTKQTQELETTTRRLKIIEILDEKC